MGKEYPVKINTREPYVVIVMGISGSGKSTVAAQLAAYLGADLVEADDFHSEAAKRQMQQGIPLTDKDREPWINRLLTHITNQGRDKGQVMAYSGLRRNHRHRFRQLPLQVVFIHLSIDRNESIRRLHQRSSHFMPASLIDSQLIALESTSGENDIIELSAKLTITQIVALATSFFD